MRCKRCQSNRSAFINGKTSDLCQAAVGGAESYGYAPLDMGVTRGDKDYIEFTYCLDCGQIQGEWPLRPCKLEKPPTPATLPVRCEYIDRRNFAYGASLYDGDGDGVKIYDGKAFKGAQPTPFKTWRLAAEARDRINEAG